MKIKMVVLLGIFFVVSKVGVYGGELEVTLFPRGATVKRVLTFQAEKGDVTVTIEGIPAEADPATFTVRSRGEFSLTTLETERVIAEGERRPEVERLRSELKRLEARQRSLKAELEVLKAQREFLSRIKDSPERDYRDLFAFVSEKLSSLAQGQRELEGKLSALKERMELVKRRLKELAYREGPVATWRVEVHGLCERSGQHAIEFLYTVPSASWTPFYRIDLRGKNLRLRLFASVSQRTGEDWTSALLTVSTGHPLSPTQPPEPLPWYVVAGERGALLKGTIPMAEKRISEVEHRGPVFLFRAARVTVPATGKPVRVLLAEAEMPVKLSWRAVPSRSEVAYLVAEGVNGSAFPLLPGEALVAVEGAGSLRIPIAYTPPGGEFRVPLGRDERVRTNKELLRTFREDVGLGGKRERVHYHYRIAVKNSTPGEIYLLLQDPLPVSRDERVKVKIRRLEPPPAKRDERGIATWKLTLPTQGEIEIEEEFYIERPRQGQPP